MGIVQREKKPHLPMAKIQGSADKKAGVGSRKSVEPVDDWKFLDEIEAPMWIDLNLEATFAYNDSDEDWFQKSHPFHQCSSSQLISGFSHSGEVCTNMEFGPNVLSSPQLPPSVSKSRGKFPLNKGKLVSSKHHPVKNLSTTSSWVNSGCDQKVKSQSRKNSRKGNVVSKSLRVNSGSDEKTTSQSSNNNRIGNGRLKPKLGCDSRLTKSLEPFLKTSTSVEESKTSLSLATLAEVKSRSASTIISGSSELPSQKLSEVSCQTVGGTSGLLSSLKITLRKSCATRQALRMEVVEGRHSEGNQSSSGKSSVGSSSNPGYDMKSTNFPKSQNKDTTPESRNIKAIPQSTKEKLKVSDMSKKSTAGSQLVPSKSSLGGKTAAVKLDHRGSVKSKVNATVNSKATKLRSSNECAIAAAKVGGIKGNSRCNALGEGKENQIGKTIGSKNSNNRVRSLSQGPKATELRNGTSQLTCPKGKQTSRAGGKSLINTTPKIHFR